MNDESNGDHSQNHAATSYGCFSGGNFFQANRQGYRVYRTAAFCIAFFFAVFNLHSFARAEAPYQVEWSVQYGSSFTEVGTAVTADSLGNAWVTGYRSASPTVDILTTKFNAAGVPRGPSYGTGGTDQGYVIAHDGTGTTSPLRYTTEFFIRRADFLV